MPSLRDIGVCGWSGLASGRTVRARGIRGIDARSKVSTSGTHLKSVTIGGEVLGVHGTLLVPCSGFLV